MVSDGTFENPRRSKQSMIGYVGSLIRESSVVIDVGLEGGVEYVCMS